MILSLGLKRILAVALTGALCLLLVTIPLRLYVSNTWVRIQYALPGLPASTRFDTQERVRISAPLLGYMRGSGSLEQMANVRTDEGEIALREDEVQHMVDVRHVIDGFWLAHWVALAVGIVSAAVLWFGRGRRQIVGAMRQSVWIMSALIGAIIVFALIDFNLFFTRFHQIFFSEGSWLFWEEDTLIQLYPLPFWVRAILAIAFTVLIEAGLLLVGAAKLARRLGQERQIP